MGDKSPKQKNKKAKQKQDVRDEKQRKLDVAASARIPAAVKERK